MSSHEQKKQIKEIFEQSIQEIDQLRLISGIEIVSCNICANAWDLEFRLSDYDSYDRDVTRRGEEKLKSALSKVLNVTDIYVGEKGFCSSRVEA